MIRKLCISIGLLVLAYVGSYSFLSFGGQYSEVENMHGTKWAVWHPVLCRRQTTWRNLTVTDITWTGGFYLPLLLIDNKLVHPTKLTYSVNGDGFRVASISDNGRKVIVQSR